MGPGDQPLWSHRRHGLDASGAEHAVVWKAGAISDLGAPDASYVDLVARALNERGAAVGDGWSNIDEAQHALLFEQGQALALNSAVDDLADWNLEDATGVANVGTIVGWGTRGGFQSMPSRSCR